MSKFDDIKKWCKDHWGLTLTKNDPSARGRWNASWKSGYSLSGQFPGDRFRHRRFKTLKAVAKAAGYVKPTAGKGREKKKETKRG